jgi:hypothetical protein
MIDPAVAGEFLTKKRAIGTRSGKYRIKTVADNAFYNLFFSGIRIMGGSVF